LKIILTVLLLLWLQTGLAQDVYQVLRDDVQGFAEVKPGVPLVFPRDHLAHPEYRIEWWYITSNLKDPQGRDWGLQWTLFRQSLSPETDSAGWDSNQVWMAHAALTLPDRHVFEQRFARGGIGQAGVSKGDSNGFDAWIDDWRWHSTSASLFPSQLEFNVAGHQVNMQLDSEAQWVLNGNQGFSQKSAQGQASYYYSQPNINLSGTVSVNGETIELSGRAWLDREWSSQALAQNQKGWDWFSLHLDDGNKLMVYQLRHDSGEHWISGSWIAATGETIALGKDDIALVVQSSSTIDTTGNNQIDLPLEWTIILPKLGRNLRIKPLYDEQWLGAQFPYWEGVVLVEDSNGQSAGKGYMELTGYE
jgi:predicted secreted hydrolase